MCISLTADMLGDAITTSRSFQAKSNKKGVILVGPPCTGKTDVARLLFQNGAKHYSSSTALQAYARRNGRSDIIEQMERGELVSDFNVLQRVSRLHYQDFIRQIREGEMACFDGWGRTAPELSYALDCLYERGEIHICFLDATDDCLWERSHRRGRNDDSSIAKRIQIYRDNVETLKAVADWRLGPQFYLTVDTTHLNQQQVFEKVYNQIWSD